MPDRTIPEFTLGDYKLQMLCDGLFRLDGGAMFGIIPKVMWERVKPCDEKNRIELSTNQMLVRRNGKNILIEGGLGDKWDEKFIKIYGITRPMTIDNDLAQIGLTPEDIDYIFLTHLHFDHCGSITKLDESGNYIPRYPNAKHFVHAQEWYDSHHPHLRNRASYMNFNYDPVHEAGLFEIWDGTDGWVDLPEGISGHLIGGHTPGMAIYKLGNEDQSAIFLGDMAPTVQHLPSTWVLGYDLDPVRATYLKEDWFPIWMENKTLVCFAHDPDTPWCYITRNKKGQFDAEKL